MSEEGKIGTLAIICATGVLVVLMNLGFKSCDEAQKHVVECVSAGRAPLECKAALDSGK